MHWNHIQRVPPGATFVAFAGRPARPQPRAQPPACGTAPHPAGGKRGAAVASCSQRRFTPGGRPALSRQGVACAGAGPGRGSAMAHAPPLAGVLETALYVDDMARACAFYEGAMGLSPMFADERLTAYPVGGRSALLVFLRGST